MNYEDEAGVYARRESRDQFRVDKNYKNFQFPQKIINKENSH